METQILLVSTDKPSVENEKYLLKWKIYILYGIETLL